LDDLALRFPGRNFLSPYDKRNDKEVFDVWMEREDWIVDSFSEYNAGAGIQSDGA
jgi:hypothetical protein